MKLKILQTGEPVLRQRARELTPEEITSPYVQTLILLMQNTLRDAPGVGLAAPQIGEPLQLAVIEDRPEYTQNLPPEFVAERERVPVPFHVIINPKLMLEEESAPAEFFEACLSMAGLIGLTPRARAVTVTCLNEHAQPITIKARGWYARILQHEIDHLQGNLYIDRMPSSRSLMTMDNYARYWKDKTIKQACQELGIK
ncbi:MAG TPA: peptide deformylase [Gammaproteobacteria bacterium]|nr:peptide deformylase [Gammaproteobacteria bacterium]